MITRTQDSQLLAAKFAGRAGIAHFFQLGEILHRRGKVVLYFCAGGNVFRFFRAFRLGGSFAYAGDGKVTALFMILAGLSLFWRHAHTISKL